MLPPASRRPSCLILHGVHHLRWCTPSSGWALHQIRCCRAANPGAMTVLVGLLRLAEITKSNESAANSVAAGAAAVGLALSLWAGSRWRNKIQSRDDRLAEL